LSIDEDSLFEGSSRRVENPTDAPSVDAKGPQEEDMRSSALAPYLQRVEASDSTEWSESTAEALGRAFRTLASGCAAQAAARGDVATLLCDLHREHRLDRLVPCRDAEGSAPLGTGRARDWMPEQLRTAASPMCKVDLLTAGLAVAFGKTGERT
jgi:hypothetical protein